MRSALADGPGAPLPAGAARRRVRRMSPSATGRRRRCSTTCRFRLAPGEVLGLLGRTGSGKTTSPACLLRLYDPTGGQHPPGRRRPARRAAAPTCAGTSAWSHRMCSCSSATRARQPDLLRPQHRRRAHLGGAGRRWGWASGCRALPHGLDTMLEAGGGGLSAGEAQLLAFTRVFLQGSRPGDPRRSVVAARPGHRAADRARGGPAACAAAPASSSPTGWPRWSAPTRS